MLVCHCHALTDRDIRRAVRSGAHTLDEVGMHCGAGTGCGGCREAVQDIVACEKRRLTMFQPSAPHEASREAPALHDASSFVSANALALAG